MTMTLAQPSRIPLRAPFVDVPICHWATPELARIAGEPQIDPVQARGSNYLAENSLRQIFEGLRCEDLEWTGGFMTEVPEGVTPSLGLSSFELRNVVSAISGEQATITFDLTATIDGERFSRSGSVELVFLNSRWFVRYASLAALELPVFP